ncbi:MAG: leucine dehydrogenase [Cyclobacteriaceae bacterium]|nr:leucine dehydrogenase [Cyclobacteriaceae bacterium]
MIEFQTQPQSLEIFQQMGKMEHEQLLFCNDKATGLKAIIAIHNTVLGPAMGGTRMWNYASEEDAIKDVLRLSRGMTFKSAIAGLNIGGGKAVIIGDARTQKNEALLRRFGQFVNNLSGKFWTAEDVNMTSQDMEYIRMETPYVTGISEGLGGSGDPSPLTAYGVYMGMKSAANKVYGSDSLKGKKIMVQGAGNVGSNLIDLLVKEKANVSVSDIYEDKIENITKKHAKIKVVKPDDVYDADMDIYSPCALGGTINDDSIRSMKCKIIAGGANNQLEDEVAHANKLNALEILFVPDFLINSGGIMNVYYEKEGNYNKEKVMAQTEKIYDICTSVLDHAKASKISTNEAALQLAMKRIEAIGKLKLTH